MPNNIIQRASPITKLVIRHAPVQWQKTVYSLCTPTPEIQRPSVIKIKVQIPAPVELNVPVQRASAITKLLTRNTPVQRQKAIYSPCTPAPVIQRTSALKTKVQIPIPIELEEI
jgi:hypothetical protein